MVESLIAFAIAAIVIGLIIGVLVFLVRRAPFIPGEFKALIEWVIIAVGIIILLLKALPLLGVSV